MSARLTSLFRFKAPTIETFVKDLQGDELDLEMAMTDEETQSLKAAIANKTWRALRAATRSSIDLLDKTEPGKSLQDLIKRQEATQDPDREGGEVTGVDGKADDVHS